MEDSYRPEAFYQAPGLNEQALTWAREALLRKGWVRAASPEGPAAATLLVRHLSTCAEPDLQTLEDRARDFIYARPTPPRRGPAPAHMSPPSDLLWIDPSRIYPNRQYRDRGDWTREAEPVQVRPNDPARGLAEFARRIIRERGDLEGLIELMGPSDYDPCIDVTSWNTTGGAFFRINYNGNHRAAAFAVLGAPCVLGTISP